MDSLEDTLRERLSKVLKNQSALSKMKDKDRYRDVKEIQSRLEDEMTPLLKNAQNLVSKFANLCEELLFQLLLLLQFLC